MKLVTHALVGLGAAAVLALGFLLPGLVSTLQDERDGKIDFYAVTQAQMTVVETKDVTDALRFTAGGFYPVVDLESGTRHTLDEVHVLVQDALDYFYQEGEGLPEFNPDQYVFQTGQAFLAASDEDGRAFVFWEYQMSLHDGWEGDIYFLIDDESGMVLTITCSRVTPLTSSEEGYSQENLFRWAQIAADYYGLEPETIQLPTTSFEGPPTNLVTFIAVEDNLVQGFALYEESSSVERFSVDGEVVPEEGGLFGWRTITMHPYFLDTIFS